MAKKEVETTPCFRKFKGGRIAGEKSYVKYYDDVEKAKQDQNKRLEPEVYTFEAVK